MDRHAHLGTEYHSIYLVYQLIHTSFVVCIALWAISVLLALCTITLILKQFIKRSINKSMLAPSTWLILGPIGNGMLGLMSLAYASHFIIIPHSMVSFQHAIQLMPGVALIIGILHTITRIQFALSWWTFTFPLAMYSLGTLAIARATDSYLFLISGIICGALLIIIWLTVAYFTVLGAYKQNLFYAPGLSDHQS